ncbi:hypothetical protein ABZ769_36755 [Streptomyces olivoreticuli]
MHDNIAPGRMSRKKKVVAGIALLTGAGLLAAGGYAAVSADAFATSGIFGTKDKATDPGDRDIALTVDDKVNADISGKFANAAMDGDGQGASTSVKLKSAGKKAISKVDLTTDINMSDPTAVELSKQLLLDVESNGKKVYEGVPVAELASKGTVPVHLKEALQPAGANAQDVRLHAYLKPGTEDKWETVAKKKIDDIHFTFTGQE